MNAKVILELDGKRFEIEDALIGAVMKDQQSSPFSVYAGHMDIGAIGISLLHILRATIKITGEELELPMNLSEDFIKFTLKEAIRLEKISRADTVASRSIEAFVKRYKDSQI